MPPPAGQFAQTGFTKAVVVGCFFQKADPRRHAWKRITLPADRLNSILNLMTHIEPPRTGKVEGIYVLTVLTGSSLEGQKLTIVTDGTGNGSFQRGDGRRVFFYSEEVAAEMEKMGQVRRVR